MYFLFYSYNGASSTCNNIIKIVKSQLLMAVGLTSVLQDCFDISLFTGGHLIYGNAVKAKPKWKVALRRPLSYFSQVEQSHLVVTLEAVHESTQHSIRGFIVY